MQQKNTPAREKISVQFVSLLGILARIGSGRPIKHVHIAAAFLIHHAAAELAEAAPTAPEHHEHSQHVGISSAWIETTLSMRRWSILRAIHQIGVCSFPGADEHNFLLGFHGCLHGDTGIFSGIGCVFRSVSENL